MDVTELKRLVEAAAAETRRDFDAFAERIETALDHVITAIVSPGNWSDPIEPESSRHRRPSENDNGRKGNN